ncbi:hypothetical protein HGRIS_014466 [Hohenbuehelia grisea]|uniref:Auxin efflux carrier n=1 Tax=Hohenbuehelia grisea TaxID=104357 RepID=A0ABR3JVQ9_9AGAR
MFSKIVPAFTSDNIGALGPLIFVAVLYEAIGVAIAWIIKQFFWVPHRFRYGVLVAGGWGNYGDIPTSVMLSITGAAPFNGTSDQNLSVAYISAFILVFMVTLFPCGGHRWVAMDYVGPDKEHEEVRELMRLRRRKLFVGWMHPSALLKRSQPAQKAAQDVEETYIDEKPSQPPQAPSNSTPSEKQHGPRHVAFHNDATMVIMEPATGAASSSVEPNDAPISRITSPAPTDFIPSRINSPAPTVTAIDSNWKQLDDTIKEESRQQQDHEHLALTTSLPPPTESVGLTPASPTSSRRRRNVVWAWIVTFVRSLCAPASLAILIAFPIAVVPKLKALFVDVPGANLPPAPDGQPPLAFVIDTAAFIGGASVPLGLICLGSALARLKIPRHQWSTLPLGAISWLAIGKLVLMPVLGVLIVHGLVDAGMIRREDKVLQFVCMFFSCLPTATTQVFLTQVYSGTGTAEHLSAFLIPQYIIMFLSITGLTAYCLSTLF